MSAARNRFSGNGEAPPEKSTFVTTCNRLSQFLKEKGNLRDLRINANFDVTGKPETSRTVDYLSNLESSVQTSAETEKSMDHLPKFVSKESKHGLDSTLQDGYTNKTCSSLPVAASAIESPSKIAQMTIFYRGQVLVFDSVSNDKARDVMLAAASASASASSNNSNNQIHLASTSNFRCEDIGLHEQILPGLQSDLPIARRASLHKFLAKRKDRASLVAPYQLHNPLTAAASNHKFDLNLKLF